MVLTLCTNNQSRMKIFQIRGAGMQMTYKFSLLRLFSHDSSTVKNGTKKLQNAVAFTLFRIKIV